MRRQLNKWNWFFLTLMFFPGAPASAAVKGVLNDWFALGSGCRAKHDLPGNVKMEVIPSESNAPDVYKVKFSLSSFEFKAATAPASQSRYGRECAIRLNINPPEGKKIVGIRALTSLVASKSPGPALDVLSELKLGPESIGRLHRTYDKSERLDKLHDDVDLHAGVGSQGALPQLGCGEPKIIGFDYSWVATAGDTQGTPISVILGKDKSLIVEATLATCS